MGARSRIYSGNCVWQDVANGNPFFRHQARAAMLVDNSGNVKSDIYAAMAVTALGVTTELSGAAQDEAVARYLLKHPHMAMFVQAPSTAVLRLAVDVYYLVNRFQKVMEYHVGR